MVAKCLDMTEQLHFPIMGIMLDFVCEKDKQDGHNPTLTELMLQQGSSTAQIRMWFPETNRHFKKMS